jgi:transcriptional regulator with XRE-family HTH domain
LVIYNHYGLMIKSVTSTDHQIAKQMRAIRIMRGLTMQDVAEEIGVSYQQFQKYEAGKNRIAASRLWDIAKLYNVPISDFFCGL